MRMKNEKGSLFYEALNGLDPTLIRDAGDPLPRTHRLLKKVLLFVISLLLFVGGCLLALRQLGRITDSGIGYDGMEGYVFYEGPVLPLTVSHASGLTARRELTYDFSDFASGGTCLTIDDKYILENQTGKDITVTAYYPFTASFADWAMPYAAVTGEGNGGAVVSGYGGEISNLTSWQDYSNMIAQDMQPAFETPVCFSEKAFLYTISGWTYPEDADTPTLSLSFVKSSGTAVLTYGMDRNTVSEEGRYTCSFALPKPGTPMSDGKLYCVLVIGEDAEGAVLRGYADSACTDALDSLNASLTRSETTVGEAMALICGDYYTLPEDDEAGSAAALYTQLCCRALDDGMPESGMLEPVLLTAMRTRRIFYVSGMLAVPAGGSVSLRFVTVKEGSYDTDCSAGGEGVMSYETLMKTGSALTITSANALLRQCDSITLIDQNYGFDVEAGILSAALDVQNECYYMRVKRKG